MRLCHGSGNLDTDGCCYVEGQPCPLRWKIQDGRILEGPGLVDRGTVDTYINSLVNGNQARNRAKAQVQGVTYICKAAVEVIAADASRLNNRAALNAAWDSHPEYVALVRPAWERVEAMLDIPAGSYQCSTWRGVGDPECCFAEDDATNAAKRANLSVQAVQVRQQNGIS